MIFTNKKKNRCFNDGFVFENEKSLHMHARLCKTTYAYTHFV